MRRPIYQILLLSTLAIVAGASVTAGLISAHFGAKRVVEQKTESMEQLARAMQLVVSDGFAPGARDGLAQELAERAGQFGQCRVTLIRSDGVVIGDSEKNAETVRLMDNHKGRPEVAEALSGRVGSSLRQSATLRRDLLYLAIPVRSGPDIVGVLRVAIPLTEVEQLRSGIRRVVTISIVMGLGLALVLSLLLARGVTRPIEEMTAVAKEMARGRFEVRAAPARIEEIHQFGQALNAMAESHEGYVESLLAERNQARAILESMAEGVLALDEEGRVLLANPAAAALFNLSPTGAKGKPLLDIIRQHEIGELAKQVRLERLYVRKDFMMFQPVERFLRVHAVPCEAGGPTGPHSVLVIEDLTELRQYERLRKDFVANVSHELKSPLTSIRGLTETLLDGALDDQKNSHRFVALIKEETDRLSRLIDDLLKLAQIESTEAPPKVRPVDVKAVLESLLPKLRPALDNRNLALRLDLDDMEQVLAEPDRLGQVFLNLLDNAIEYNRDGGTITVTARPEEGFLRVSVHDTGIGIPSEDILRIFERFYRVDKARSRRPGGTGLGLSIVKHIVESYGGRVSVESRVEHGSTFSFTLPIHRERSY
jgi:two-component system phosphate regulon sensor histidine kinase PhoR